MHYQNNTNSLSNFQGSQTLKDTMKLLTLVTGFSALMAFVNMSLGIVVNPLITLIVFFAISFGLHRMRNSSMAVLLTFVLTGWLGFTIGPIIQLYSSIPGGNAIIMNAFGGTALIFALSTFIGYKKPLQMSQMMARNLMISSFVVLGLSLINIFFLQMPLLSVLISAFFLVLSTAYLTYTMSDILKENPNMSYIDATVTIFISLFNIFMSLLNILGLSKE